MCDIHWSVCEVLIRWGSYGARPTLPQIVEQWQFCMAHSWQFDWECRNFWQEAYLSSLIESQNSCFPQGRTPGWWSDSEGILMTRHDLKLHVLERWNSKWMCLCWDIFCKRNYIANTYRAIVSNPVQNQCFILKKKKSIESGEKSTYLVQHWNI